MATVCLAYAGLANPAVHAGPAPVEKAAGGASVITVTPAQPVPGKKMTLTGSTGTKVKRKAVLQERVGGKWRKVATTKTTKRGDYTFTRTAPQAAVTVRVAAPKHIARANPAGGRGGQDANTYPKRVSPARTIKPTPGPETTPTPPPTPTVPPTPAPAPSGTLAIGPTPGDVVTTRFTGTFTPADPGAGVLFQRYGFLGWITVGTSEQAATGSATWDGAVQCGTRLYRALSTTAGGAEIATATVSYTGTTPGCTPPELSKSLTIKQGTVQPEKTGFFASFNPPQAGAKVWLEHLDLTDGTWKSLAGPATPDPTGGTAVFTLDAPCGNRQYRATMVTTEGWTYATDVVSYDNPSPACAAKLVVTYVKTGSNYSLTRTATFAPANHGALVHIEHFNDGHWWEYVPDAPAPQSTTGSATWTTAKSCNGFAGTYRAWSMNPGGIRVYTNEVAVTVPPC
ncbi:hypothetical protein GCM10023339_46530 [Alloalcanivorax gelatiniphagus]